MTDETKHGPVPPHMAGEAGKVDPESVGRIEQPKHAAQPAKQAAPAATPARPAKPEKRLHHILSNEEVLAARAKAREKLEAEQKAFAISDVEKQELARLRDEESMTVGGADQDLVNVTIDLPEFADCLKTNMRPFWHGQTYKVPRHVADDLRWRMQAAWQHQLLQIDGKKLRDTYYRNAALNLGMSGTKISGSTMAVVNEPGIRH